MIKLAALRLCFKVLAVAVLLITAAVWFFLSSDAQEIYIAMNSDIQFEEVHNELGKEPEYRATSSINMQNIPDYADKDYKVKIKVKLYKDASRQKEITDHIHYELEKDVPLKNGTQPINLRLKIKDSSLANASIHVVMSAELEKVNI